MFGGGASSGTATEGSANNNQKEESKESSFKAFKGKGAKLGSDLPKSAVAAKMEQIKAASNKQFGLGSSSVSPNSAASTTDLEKGQSRNLAGLSALVKGSGQPEE